MISILMPVRNGARHLKQALESIICQTYDDFELIISDDESNDQTPIILKYYAAKDRRIRVKTQCNLGVTKTLNASLSIARGEYIARMDADDVCEPTRLERQIQFMNNNSDISAIGCWVKIINDQGIIYDEWMPPPTTSGAFWQLMFSTVIPHPAALIRRSAMETVHGYDDDIAVGQDYDLWTRMTYAGLKITNLPEYLLRYRIHRDQISHVQSNAQRAQSHVISKSYISWLLGGSVEDYLLDNFVSILQRDIDTIDINSISNSQDIAKIIAEAMTSKLPKNEQRQMLRLMGRRFAHASKLLAMTHPLASLNVFRSMIGISFRLMTIKGFDRTDSEFNYRRPPTS